MRACYSPGYEWIAHRFFGKLFDKLAKFNKFRSSLGDF